MFKKNFEENEMAEPCKMQTTGEPIRGVEYLRQSLEVLKKEINDLREYLGVHYCERGLVKKKKDENEKTTRLFNEAYNARIMRLQKALTK
jgi:hypothetical protein